MENMGHTAEILTEEAYQRFIKRTTEQRMDDLEVRVALLEKQCVRYSDAGPYHKHLVKPVGRE